MKTSTILLALMSLTSASLVNRQESSSSALTTSALTSSPPATTATASIDNSPISICLAACNPTDVNCRAQCVGGAHPNSAQVDATNSCIVACPVGDGSTSATNKYNACVQSCITSHYLMEQTVGPSTMSGGSGSGTSAGVSAQTTSTSASGSASTGAGQTSRGQSSSARTSGTGTQTSGSTVPTTSTNAASGPIVMSAGGIAGLFLAFFAL